MSMTSLECEQGDCSRPAQASIREGGRSLHVCSTCAEEMLEDQQPTRPPEEVA